MSCGQPSGTFSSGSRASLSVHVPIGVFLSDYHPAAGFYTDKNQLVISAVALCPEGSSFFPERYSLLKSWSAKTL